MEELQEVCQRLLEGKRGDRGEFDHPDHGPCQLRRTRTGYRLTMKHGQDRRPMLMSDRAKQDKLGTGSE